MQKSWDPKKLNELGFIGRGRSRHRPRNEASLFGGIYPFIQTGDIREANLYITHYTQTYNVKGLAQSKLWNPGTLCITIAANVAETAILKIKACFPDSVVGFIPYPNKADVRFVKYYIDMLKLQMQNISHGTTQDNLSLDKLLTFDILTPPPPIQRSIASILSTYDDLIENNTRRIAILEEMAQILYQEWFVKFRFPGYEQMKMVETELGMIPEGWEVVRFIDIVDVYSGGTPKTTESEFWNGDIPFYTPKDAPSSFFVTETEKSITESGLKTCNSKLYAKNTVFITARGTVGKVVLNAVDMAMNQSCYALQGRGIISQLFVFMHIKNYINYLKQTANGAVFDTIIVDTFKQLKVIKPLPKQIDEFTEALAPIFNQILKLTFRNTVLRRARDLLLPKLISGEINVASWIEGAKEDPVQELFDNEESVTGIYEHPKESRMLAETRSFAPIEQDEIGWQSLWEMGNEK